MESEIQRLGGDILKHPRYLQLLQFQHHGAENSVYDHSVAVAQAAYAIARRMRLSGDETASVIRAASVSYTHLDVYKRQSSGRAAVHKSQSCGGAPRRLSRTQPPTAQVSNPAASRRMIAAATCSGRRINARLFSAAACRRCRPD